MQYQYYLIDAFTNEVFQGAPIVVFLEATGLTAEKMQLIAREMNQTETVFLFSSSNPKEPWRIKIYNANKELDFGGHPIIAASYALAIDGKLPEGLSVLQLNNGLIDINIYKKNDKVESITFSNNTCSRLDDYVPSVKELAEILHLEVRDFEIDKYKPMIAGCEDDYLIIPVKSQEALRKACFNLDKWTMSFVATLAKKILLFSVNKTDKAIDFNARLMGKGISASEDPPIGSTVPAFGAYLFSKLGDGCHKAVLQRGEGERRKSILEVEVINADGKISQINVGGNAVLVAEGSLN